MFLGTWEYSIDSLGQLVLPTPYRSALREGVVITRGFDSCLQCFSPAAWLRFAQGISGLPLGIAEVRSLRRLLFGAASEAQLDRLGRVALTHNLRVYAGLGDTAVIAGLDSYFEIWSPARWRGETQRFQQLAPGQFDLPPLVSAADTGHTRSPHL
ncbi:MAG: division/cell wall cluster transcriptional repressor MraZ [Chloroflexales bacterium]|nr:division/cell wall cluster transcriptional repressor MraZ [Chloroflexales bacterium]